MTPSEQSPEGPRSAMQATPGSPFSAEQWRDVQRLVDGALDLPPTARAAYLDESCGANVALREHATRLVNACERAARADGLLAAPAIAFAAPLLADLTEQDASRADQLRPVMVDALRAALSGRYAVEREIGRGGMATVYLARDVRHDRVVAVKVLERNVPHAGAERFLHEIRTAARLTHPHVLGVHDSGEADGLLYYVMPYVEGETLRARLTREGALPLPDAVRLMRELADALAYAHGRGVMHRDLKPENVLLSGGHAVVADFGIAKALAAATGGDLPERGAGDVSPASRLTATGVALGTPAYMAPEQAVGDLATDHRADLYALGVVAYEALAGAHPFGTRSPQALVAAHLTEPPAPLGDRRTDASPALAALVMRLLAKDPAARPQSAAAVLRALDDAPPLGMPASVPLPAPSAALAETAAGRRRRVAVLAAAAALVLAAGVGGYALWRRAPALGGRDAAAAGVEPAAIRAVAVLPFENTGGAAADDYFSDGMTDELAHALSRLPGLRLAGRTSSYAFKGKAAAAQEIGRVLGVGAYVGGTVRRAGDRLRVTTQLVGTADGKVLWDSVFESRSSDVFGVQDEFTRAIVAALAASLGGADGALVPDAARGTTNQEAYDLYLKARYFWLNRNAANITRSVTYYRQAIARDPNFARAHAGLALAYAILPVYIPDPTDSTTALNASSAQRAIALDSTLADAQIALGLGFERQLRFRDAQARYRAALALEPSSVIAHHVLGFILHATGHPDEALVELRQATQLDPLAKSAASAFAVALSPARDDFPKARLPRAVY